MKLLEKIIVCLMLSILLSAMTCGEAQAFRGGWGGGRGGWGGWWIAPYPYPYYDPYYYPPSGYYAPNYGELKTDVKPNKAEVWVDGKLFGFVKDFDGPINHLKLPVGMHKVQFKDPDYRTFSINVYIAPGRTSDIEYKLVPLPPASPPPSPNEGSPKKGGDE